MKLGWYCGMNADAGGFFTEPTECCAEGVLELSAQQEQDWEDELSPCYQCPDCGQILEDPSHYGPYNECPVLAGCAYEPPYSEEWFKENDHVLHEGGVWRVVKQTTDTYDSREQKLDIEWVAGPRMGSIVYATGIRSSDLSKLADMEVLAFSAVPEDA